MSVVSPNESTSSTQRVTEPPLTTSLASRLAAVFTFSSSAQNGFVDKELAPIQRAIAHEWQAGNLNPEEMAIWEEHQRAAFMAPIGAFVATAMGLRFFANRGYLTRYRPVRLTLQALPSAFVARAVWQWRFRKESDEMTERLLALSESHVARGCRMSLRVSSPNHPWLKEFDDIHGADYDATHEIIEPHSFPDEYPMPDEVALEDEGVYTPHEDSTSTSSSASSKRFRMIASPNEPDLESTSLKSDNDELAINAATATTASGSDGTTSSSSSASAASAPRLRDFFTRRRTKKDGEGAQASAEEDSNFQNLVQEWKALESENGGLAERTSIDASPLDREPNPEETFEEFVEYVEVIEDDGRGEDDFDDDDDDDFLERSSAEIEEERLIQKTAALSPRACEAENLYLQKCILDNGYDARVCAREKTTFERCRYKYNIHKTARWVKGGFHRQRYVKGGPSRMEAKPMRPKARDLTEDQFGDGDD